MLLYNLCPIGITENIGKERDTDCSTEDADDVEQCNLQDQQICYR